MSNQNRGSGRRLLLNDGTVYENGVCGLADGILWCTIPDITIEEAAVKFMDKNATQKIVFEYGEMSSTYEGFTTVTAIMKYSSTWKISLIKKEGVNDE